VKTYDPATGEEIYPGTIVRSEVDEDGNPVARRLPWWESGTAYGKTGSGETRLRRRRYRAEVKSDPVIKRSGTQKAEHLAGLFVSQLRQMEQTLGRPVVPADLSEEWLRAFGLELWRGGAPITTDHLRQVAVKYLEATARGAGRDVRWTPNG
jgi:hypothetical protein